MGRISDIDEQEFRRMYAADVPTPVMAKHFGIGREGISKAARRFGVTVRQRGGVGLAKKPPKQPPKQPDTGPRPRSDSIAATQGRYAHLCEYAERNGLTYRQALKLWHRERVGA